MKDFKKRPTKQLEKFSNIFMQLGLVLVLFVVYITLEHQTVQKSVSIVNISEREPTHTYQDQNVIIVKEKTVKTKQEILKKDPFILEEVVKGNDKVIENIIDFSKDKTIEVIDIEDIIEVPIDKPIEENVPFINIEEAPVFEGCEGLSKKENKRCFERKMKQFVQRNFNPSIASELGLDAGSYKIQTQFIIDKEGNVIDVKIRAPHKRLKNETKKLINKLPKFTPGKQRNRPVKVRYILPIAFKVD